MKCGTMLAIVVLTMGLNSSVLADWSNSAPTNASGTITGPGAVVWRAHLAAQGTNAHWGLIASNQLGDSFGWVNGRVEVTNAPDSALSNSLGTAAFTSSNSYDAAGAAAAVSNATWNTFVPLGTFGSFTGTVAYLSQFQDYTNWVNAQGWVTASVTNKINAVLGGRITGVETGKVDNATLDSVSNSLHAAITGETSRAIAAESLKLDSNVWANADSTTNTATKAQGAKADTALQSESDTNALAQLAVETNRAYVVETNLQAQINGKQTAGDYLTNIIVNGIQGTASNGMADVTIAAGNTYRADNLTLKLLGDTFSIQDSWISTILGEWFDRRTKDVMLEGGYIIGPAYVFDDQGGILPARSSGQNWVTNGYNNLVCLTSTTTVTAVIFDGANDFGVVESLASYDPAGSFSFSGWLYWTANDNDIFVTKGGPDSWAQGAGWLAAVQAGAGDRLLVSSQGAYLYTTTAMPRNDWTHVAVVWDVASGSSWTNIHLYVDGVEVSYAGGDGTFGDLTTTNALMLGGNAGGMPFKGRMDESAIYGRALSQSEITQLSTNRVIPNSLTNGIIARWHMDEGTGTAFADDIGGNTGELVNGPTWTNDSTVAATPNGGGDMLLVSTNKLLDFIASNAVLSAIITTTNGTLTAANMQLGLVDVVGNVTNWSDTLTYYDTLQTNKLYMASVTNVAGRTNVSAAIKVSSNVVVTVKGLAAPCAP